LFHVGDDWRLVHRSEPIHSTTPEFPPFSLSVQSVCDGFFDRALVIKLMHKTSAGADELIGQCTTTPLELVTKVGHRLRLSREPADAAALRAAWMGTY
jgi:hypothetical protein